MIKIPFLNRQRYIILRCYTWSKMVEDYAPIRLGKYDDRPIKNDRHQAKTSFSKCYAHINSRIHSATVKSPTTFRINVKYGEINYDVAAANEFTEINLDHNNDPEYSVPDTILTKIVLPWYLEEKSGVPFVLSRHIQNKTPMMIPSGVVEYKFGYGMNIFNHVSKLDHNYEITFREPLVSLYPISDLPLHVETYTDRKKFLELNSYTDFLPYFSNYRMKLKGIKKGS